MPLIAATADLHIGNHKRFGGTLVAGINARCRSVLDALRAATERAAAEGAKVFLVAGDVFDDDRPLPQVTAAVQDIFSACGMDVILLVGNHDQTSTTGGDHALGPLREVATIVETPAVLFRGGMNIACFPYDPRPAGEWFAPAVDDLLAAAPADLLAVHLGIMDDHTPPWLRDARDAIPSAVVLDRMLAHDVPLAVAGNWHNHASWVGGDEDQATLVQCGALVPTGWDNEGVDGYGGLVLFDTDAQTARGIEVPGPRFVRVRNLTDLKKVERKARERKLTLYVRMVAPPEDVGSMRAELEAAQNRSPEVAAFEVEADAGLVTAAARNAAHAATKAETLDEALGAFVAQMALDEDLSREDVRSRCAAWLGGGS